MRARAIVIGLSRQASPADVATARSGLATEIDLAARALGDSTLATRARAAYKAGAPAPDELGLPFD